MAKMLHFLPYWFLWHQGRDLPKIDRVLGLIFLIFRRAFLFKFVLPGFGVVLIVVYKKYDVNRTSPQNLQSVLTEM